MPETITRFGQVKWNLTPSTTFATTLSQSGWVMMTVDSTFEEWESKFGLFKKGSLVTRFSEYPNELKQAIPWLFDPNYYHEPEPGYADYIDESLPTDEEISDFADETFDWELERRTQIKEEKEIDEMFPELDGIAEADFIENHASYGEDDGWDMIGFMSKLSEILKAPVAFNRDNGKLEIAFKPTQPIRNPDRMIQMIARKISAWVEENTQE